VLAPSQYAERTDALFALGRSIGFRRGADPLSTLRELMALMYREFEYCPQATRVDSRIDEALEARRGVCQDFSHIFIAWRATLESPHATSAATCFGTESVAERSADGATHAWAEALMPGLGWVGFDPTNNVIAHERHIRVAIGRDYADVPPTRGVYKGVSAVRTELAVSVRIGPVRSIHNEDAVPFTPWMSRDATVDPRDAAADQQQQ
jgi:transglutaminase-like putative cysteine protease